jgi:glycosyltransferase involved in cell wall biosynthesis
MKILQLFSDWKWTGPADPVLNLCMAGSDRTAQALREAMAMGKPAIVADRGTLPELVDHGVSGLVVRDTPESLAEALLQVLRYPEIRRAMGKAAWEKAHREFRLDRQGEAVEKFYQEMIELGKWKKRNSEQKE